MKSSWHLFHKKQMCDEIFKIRITEIRSVNPDCPVHDTHEVSKFSHMTAWGNWCSVSIFVLVLKLWWNTSPVLVALSIGYRYRRSVKCPVCDTDIPKILQMKYNWWIFFSIWLEDVYFCQIGISNAKKQLTRTKSPFQINFRQKVVLNWKRIWN